LKGVLSVGTLGLLPGAFLGGHLADFVGRKRVLMLSMLIYGVFSVATASTSSFATLATIRFLTGLGLGGALPNLIALTTEAAPRGQRNRAISIMYAGMPLGGVIAALTGLFLAGSLGWHAVFYVGGVLPLLLLPVMYAALPESQAFVHSTGPAKHPASIGNVLFEEGRLPITLLLWVSCFFTLLVVYLLLNWLPSLLIGRGLSHAQAGQVQILFNIGASIGSIAFGILMDRSAAKLPVIIMYGGILLSLLALDGSGSFAATLGSAATAGFFVVGGQLVLYALAPGFYDVLMRGTGVGAAVGVGRLGAVTGPLAGGAILAQGLGSNFVLLAMMPGLLLAAISALMLVSRDPRPLQQDPLES
jgi:AAHS family 3-hydroxyphenylpropionic acid transporter